MTEPVNIVLTADGNYVVQIGVTMASILKNMAPGRAVRFWLITDGFSQGDLARLDELRKIHDCEITNIRAGDHMRLIPRNSATSVLHYLSDAVFYRLLMFKILPPDVKRCAYVDCDMIVVTDLSEVYDSLPEGRLLSAVVEYNAMKFNDPHMDFHRRAPDFARLFSEPRGYPYFNAGFFVADIAAAKREKVFEQLVGYLARHPDTPYNDQDALNAVFGQKYRDRMRYLPLKYNFFSFSSALPFEAGYYSKIDLGEAAKDVRIYHYSGLPKPWEKASPYFYVWWDYYAVSPFKGLKKPRGCAQGSSRRNSLVVKLFGIMLWRIADYGFKKKYYLFGFMPIWRSSYIYNVNKGFIPLLGNGCCFKIKGTLTGTGRIIP
ncbi:MAG: glycosyltransferase family 8 protein [Rickettsiales bacterium]|jgi:lipopolysaccharide biosynthesis glycosyltransferase|nr:glycosyltransferase family 8 protein [Rickettsiales bacterium]